MIPNHMGSFQAFMCISLCTHHISVD